MYNTCPVCEASVFPVRAVSTGESARHFVNPGRDRRRFERLLHHIQTLWGGDQAVIRRCTACGLSFCDPLVAGDSEFYNTAYERTSYPEDKWDFSRTIDGIKEMQLDSVLEVGAGFGHFLKKIAPRPSRIIAYEYDKTALTVLQNHGFQTVAGDFRSSESIGDLDAVFMFQVLEHLGDPIGSLRTAANMLKPGGHLYITVPNVMATRFQEDSGSLLDMPPNHITNWTIPAFKVVAERVGLSVAAIDVEPFSLFKHIKRDIVYYFMRRAQTVGSLASRIHSTNNKMLMAAGMLALSPCRIKWWMKAAANAYGHALWVHLVKP